MAKKTNKLVGKQVDWTWTWTVHDLCLTIQDGPNRKRRFIWSHLQPCRRKHSNDQNCQILYRQRIFESFIFFESQSGAKWGNTFRVTSLLLTLWNGSADPRYVETDLTDPWIQYKLKRGSRDMSSSRTVERNKIPGKTSHVSGNVEFYPGHNAVTMSSLYNAM